MLKFNTNLSSLIVQSNLQTSTLGLNQAIERMTTGFKINGAKDNAAGYSIATNMSTKIGAYQVAEDNAIMGLNMLNTASESLNTMSNIAMRLRSLAMQIQNGTCGSSSVEAINAEAVSLINELYREKNNAEYNGISLFGGRELPAEITFPDGSTQKSRGFLKEVNPRDTSTMTSVASLDESVSVTGGTYSISTPEELEKASRLIRNKQLVNAEFVLANNIDMSEWSEAHGSWKSFAGGTKFDGNGYVIANAELNGSEAFFAAGCVISNLGLENIRINSPNADGASAFGQASQVTNCFATGKITGKNGVGGLVSNTKGVVIKDCYTDVDVSGNSGIGGLVGVTNLNASIVIENSFSMGSVKSYYDGGGLIGGLSVRGDMKATIVNCVSVANVTASAAGGLIGSVDVAGALTINNCYATGAVEGSSNAGGLIASVSNATDVSKITNSYYNQESTGQNDTGKGIGVSSTELYKMVLSGALPDYDLDLPVSNIFDISFRPLYSPQKVGFQVGIVNDAADIINMNLSFEIDGLKELCYLGLDNEKSLEIIDKMLASINSKASEFSTIQNRLESALEEISIQYENLVSSRSTIRDADIAEESSEYIKMQILQYASATLLATANQTPSIALQLL